MVVPNNNRRDGSGAARAYPFLTVADAEAASALADIQVTISDASFSGLQLVRLLVSQRTVELADMAGTPITLTGVEPQVMTLGDFDYWHWYAADYSVQVTISSGGRDYTAGPPLQLAARCVRTAAERLRKLTFATVDGDITFEEGDVRMRGGFNTELDSEPGVLEVSIIPRSGDGLFEDCDDTSGTVRSLGGQSPTTDGNLSIQPDDCIRIEPALIKIVDGGYEVTPGRLFIHDDCKPCCDCEEKAAVWRAAKIIQDRLISAVEKYQYLREYYNDKVNAMNLGADCALRPLLNADLIADINNNLGLYISVCNGTGTRLENVVISVSQLWLDGMSPIRYDSVGEEFFRNNPGIIEIPDDSQQFYSLHQAIRQAKHLELSVFNDHGYAYSLGHREHTKFPGATRVNYRPFSEADYAVVADNDTRAFYFVADGGGELDFHCLEPGDTRYFNARVYFSTVTESSTPVTGPSVFEHRRFAIIVHSPSHPELNVVAKMGTGVGIDGSSSPGTITPPPTTTPGSGGSTPPPSGVYLRPGSST